jgi:uncharacterized protein
MPAAAAVALMLFAGLSRCDGEADPGAAARRYRGTIGGFPIVMTLQRHGSQVSGVYRYTRMGITLHLEGDWHGGSARLREIYGRNSRTATIVARQAEDGSLDGTWVKSDGSKSLSFHAEPLGSAAHADTGPRLRNASVDDRPKLKAHRRPATASRRAQNTRTAARHDPNALLLEAVRRGDTEKAREMLDADAEPDARDKQGRTVLMLASTFRNDASEATSFSSIDERLAFVQLLLARGAEVDARDHRGYTALMYSAASWGAGNPIIRVLLDANADVNALNNYQGTALMIATGKFGHVNTVRLLIDAGADLDLRDKFGHTALWYARSHHATASVRVLEQAGAAE